VKKLYKCLKDFAPCRWKAGQDYELDESDAIGFVESGHLEPLADDELSAMEQSLLKRLEASTAAVAAQAAVKALESVHYGGAAGKGPRVEVVLDEADKTKGLGEFLQCVGFTGLQNHPKKEWAFEKLAAVYSTLPDPTFKERYAKSQETMGVASYKAALAESSGITGGYTVPVEYATQLLELSAEDTLLVGQTDEYALTGRELKMPVLDQTTAPSVGNTAYFGGVIATWTGEAVQRPETEPKFKEITLVANELSGYALASRNVLFDNKVALEQRLTRLFAGAIGWYRDFAYLQGDGVAKPRGLMNAPATLTVNRQTPNQVNFADVAQMIGKLLPQSMKTAFWVMQQSALQSFLQMKDASNRLIVQPYFPNAQGGPATVRPAMLLLGLPIKTTEKTSTLGTPGDLLLVDPKQYFTATRQDIEIAASEHYKFLNNQVTYRFIFRGDGEPWLDAPFTMQDGVTQVSPFVKLV
jgi:HK97 family phage major capsid protein